MPVSEQILTTPSNRSRLLESAKQLFASRGFGGTSIKEIARHAGVSQGLMYSYFASKDELLRAIFDEGVQGIWSTMPAASDDPFADIETLLRQSFAAVEGNESLWRLLYTLRFQHEIVRRLSFDIEALGASVETGLAKLCSRAGLAKPEIEAKALFALIDGANQHRTLNGGPAPDAQRRRIPGRGIDLGHHVQAATRR